MERENHITISLPLKPLDVKSKTPRNAKKGSENPDFPQNRKRKKAALPLFSFIKIIS